MKPSTGSVTTAPIAAPTPSVEASRNAGARVRRQRRRRRRGGCGCRCAGLVGDGARLRLDRGHLVPHVAGDVPRPEDPERDREDRADRRDDPGDDEADAAGTQPRSRSRSARGSGLVRAGCRDSCRSTRALPWIQYPWSPACQRRAVCRDVGILHFAEDACQEMRYSAQRRVTRSRISSLMTISSGHGRASSSGSLCVASMPSLPP